MQILDYHHSNINLSFYEPLSLRPLLPGSFSTQREWQRNWRCTWTPPHVYGGPSVCNWKATTLSESTCRRTWISLGLKCGSAQSTQTTHFMRSLHQRWADILLYLLSCIISFSLSGILLYDLKIYSVHIQFNYLLYCLSLRALACCCRVYLYNELYIFTALYIYYLRNWCNDCF